MGFDEGALERVAALARLRLTEEERARLAGDLEGILAYFRDLEDAALDGAPEDADGAGACRADEVAPPDEAAVDAVLANVPRLDGGLVRVPRGGGSA